MEHFGYKQSLDRGIGAFGSFAAGVSYISILTGTFQLFYFGFGTAGPAYLWSWPLVLVGQLAVALCFMELAAKYPICGSVYNWSKLLGSRIVSWSSGWLMLTASIVTLSAVVLALQLNLPRLWSGFQIIGDGSGTYDFATNAVILGTVLILFTTVVNALGVRLMARINSAGVFIELIAACLIAIFLALNIKRGSEVFFSTAGYGAGKSGGFLGAFLVASLASGYVMYGFDTASSLGEETLEPRRTAPRAILRAILASFVIGGAILVSAGQDLPGLHRGRGDGVLAGRAYRGHPLDLRNGARQRTAVRGEACAGEFQDSDAHCSCRRDRGDCRADPGPQHRTAEDFHGADLDCRHHDLPGVPDGDGPTAEEAPARAMAPRRSRSRWLLHHGQVGNVRQHRRGAVGHGDGDQPGLAARSRVRRALVQHLGCVRLHRHDSRSRSVVVRRQGPPSHRHAGFSQPAAAARPGIVGER